jgi:penicillin-binding protein 1A
MATAFRQAVAVASERSDGYRRHAIEACAAAAATAHEIWGICSRALRRRIRVVLLLACAVAGGAVPVAVTLHHVYFDRGNLPDPGPFVRFEFPAIGHVYDANGGVLIELAREYRLIITSKDIPPVVRDAILAVEDKRFFLHGGVDYSSFPRVLAKVRMDTLVARLFRKGRGEDTAAPAIFPQGGSTITQQLVRGYFLKSVTSQENSNQLRHGGRLPRALSYLLGPRNANMLARKLEEIRLSLWLEREMTRRFGSKRRAKEEILARYASFVHMGHGQYGFARAATYYFGRPLATFTAADADKAALLAGIPKSPRDYAPSAAGTQKVLRRRNQTLALMAANGFLSAGQLTEALQRPIQIAARSRENAIQAPAAVGNVLEELRLSTNNGIEDLLQGRIHVYSTVDARVQHIVNEALEHGLAAYEKRHTRARGLIQGSVVVLNNRDAGILAETGGRRFYQDRPASYSDFNRVTASLRQPGSAMKPIVYLAAFRQGVFNLESIVPDEPISVPDGNDGEKWVSNYDGFFKGPIPLRQALAESRNAVAIWITKEIGIDSVLRMSQGLGVQTPLQRYATTALGASEMNLLELANAYRTMASGLSAQPYVIRTITSDWGAVVADRAGRRSVRVAVNDDALSLIQEGLRGVVRMPTGTAHSLDSAAFPIAVMGKTGTTSDFRDALFVGSTWGPKGITVAVRIGFDDNGSLGSRETGGRVALPVFREVMLRVYRDQIVGPAPVFPAEIEERISLYLQCEALARSDAVAAAESESRAVASYRALPEETEWLLRHATSFAAAASRSSSPAPPAGPVEGATLASAANTQAERAARVRRLVQPRHCQNSFARAGYQLR